MSWVEIHGDGEMRYAEEKEFHRVSLMSLDVLQIRAQEKPVAVWVPAGYSVDIRHNESGVVLDIAEVVEHQDIVSLDKTIREEVRKRKRAEVRERQAKRRLRGQAERPKGDDRP